MTEYPVKSLGFGVYHVGAATVAEARHVGSQIAEVVEAWTDPDLAGSHTVILSEGFPTSVYEARVASDPEVSETVRRAASCSPPGSAIRSRLPMVSAACANVLGGAYDRSSLEA